MPRPKTGKRKGDLATQLWRLTARLVVTCLSPNKPVNCLLIVRSRSCEGRGTLCEGGTSWEEYGPEIYAGKRKQIVSRMSNWRTDQIGRKFLDALIPDVAAVNKWQAVK